MTTEEAISWLRQIDERYIHGGDEGFDNRRKEAIEAAISALRAQQERENPMPLTLDELREMDGEPVWIEPIDSEYRRAGWGIVHLCPPPDLAEPQCIRVLDGVTCFEQTLLYPKKKRIQLYGKTWLAYRQKRRTYEPARTNNESCSSR